MIGRPFRVDWRPEDTPEALKAAYLSERDGTVRTRLHGLWLLGSGWRLSDVASAVGVHYRTVQTWVGWYREGGVEEVVSHKMGGRGTPRYLRCQGRSNLRPRGGAKVYHSGLDVQRKCPPATSVVRSR